MKMLLVFWKGYRLHILLWAIYIIYESVLIGVFYQKFGKFENYASHFSLNIALFYVHSWVLSKVKFLKNKDYLLILLIAAIEIVAYIPLLAQFNQWLTDFNQPTPGSALGIDHRFILGAIYRSLYFILFSTGFWFLNRFLKEKQLTQKLEKGRLEAIIGQQSTKAELAIAENAFIRAQINPHLLFNTLNFVHRRIKTTDSEAGELILLLAKMMRYSIGLNQTEQTSPLIDEILQVENLINLFQIKESYSLSIHFDYQENLLNQRVIPLALLTLSENVFKHGVLDDHRNPASISISLVKNTIIIKTINKIIKKSDALSTNTGLKNLNFRLVHVYGDTFNYSHSEIDGTFYTTLELPTIETPPTDITFSKIAQQS
ncbi:sensor histidine kinase [Pedobacter sp. Leaf194]|uniref:sensor histidine kinase n=1 Tax=Pedobacter sp. Leaf194 TaxID=1736297 RepID=UPI00070333B4|nr:sensor histidine kinase [Pedobacter sp. Leaf194]KQS36818.1 hypothetical protein ASG14_07210 [Pedobacter sp. Leaf194]